MPTILLATANPHKVAELRAILADAPATFLSLADLPIPTTEPEESGDTFEENATIKALAYAEQTGNLCLADDSGLEVDALNGKPGVISSHYATDGRDTGMTRDERDAANNQRLLRDLEGVPLEQRTARFICVMVLAAPPSHAGNRILAVTRGAFEGRIGLPPDVPRGTHGFGYDPLLLIPPDYTRTSAELTPKEKNTRSHRAAAARAMANVLRDLNL